MSYHTRPSGPPTRPPLRVGDLVSVVYRTGAGPASWTGSVVEDLGTTVRISDGRRTHVAAIKGAAYIHVMIPAAERVDLIDGIPANLAHAAHPDHAGQADLTYA